MEISVGGWIVVISVGIGMARTLYLKDKYDYSKLDVFMVMVLLIITGWIGIYIT